MRRIQLVLRGEKKDSAPRRIQGRKGLVRAVQVQRASKTKGQQSFPGGSGGRTSREQSSKSGSQTLTRNRGSSHRLS